MYNESERLRESNDLKNLLAHYAALGAEDRTIWQDRLMDLDGVEAMELVKLHGEILGHEWIEMNLGNTKGAQAGVVPACYRITTAGIRALRQENMEVAAE